MGDFRAAVRHLKRVDPVLARVIETVGPCRLESRREGTHFQALVRSIVFQQLSGKAAATILSRFNSLYPANTPSPEAVLATSDEQLRAVGLSRQKIGYMRDLASKVTQGTLPLDAVDSMDDDDLIAHLVQVKGIGRWTAQMFLMFRLDRRDVLPELDLGIQNAIKRAYRKRKRPTPKDVRRIGAKWSPHSSVASWYLWRSLENGDGQLGAE
ncbi:MAG TPA: DNA-3-methyladenine glycosylase [Gemmatimonadaceae bacterium]|jgi:3-methyladenine DNA glycosylase/8-oxoguanine DNA glycosylase|nr:DNA-3-methyladenine glycosylase [Gemmatimonadaceae bacterium]